MKKNPYKKISFRLDEEVEAAIAILVKAEGAGSLGRKRSMAIRRALLHEAERIRALLKDPESCPTQSDK